MIQITRESALAGAFNAYEIFVDDICRGKIRAGETKVFEVDNGSHSVYFKVGWCRSHKLNVDINNSAVALELGCSVKSLGAGVHLIYQMFFKDKYLWIKKLYETPKTQDGGSLV